LLADYVGIVAGKFKRRRVAVSAGIICKKQVLAILNSTLTFAQRIKTTGIETLSNSFPESLREVRFLEAFSFSKRTISPHNNQPKQILSDKISCYIF
jgi:hypothetical protein